MRRGRVLLMVSLLVLLAVLGAGLIFALSQTGPIVGNATHITCYQNGVVFYEADAKRVIKSASGDTWGLQFADGTYTYVTGDCVVR